MMRNNYQLLLMIERKQIDKILTTESKLIKRLQDVQQLNGQFDWNELQLYRKLIDLLIPNHYSKV
eukprot:UN15714